ncbi:MAG: hypothetical protein J0M24_21930 [Verrucomicrobia bacterium]|nr:hypothetical protein [Verrucomicrobiota bacterium]
MSAAPGDLDLSFDPPSAWASLGPGFAVVDGQTYYVNSARKLARLREDGSADEDWALAIPAQGASSLTSTAFGGWVVRDFSMAYLVHPDQSFQRLAVNMGFSSDFPEDDGGVVIDGLRKIGHDGQVDLRFARNRSVVGTSFNDGAGTVVTGGIFVSSARDRQGSYLVAGNFREVDGIERWGLVRFRTDGSVDLKWNPAPALKIESNGTNGINCLPNCMSSGPNDSVVVCLSYVSTNGLPDQRLARITATGEVEAVFSVPTRTFSRPLVQPDGKILFAGQFAQWDGQPATGLVRLHPNGSLDSSFSLDLTATNTPNVYAVEHDGSGRIWLRGSFTHVHGIARPGVARVFAWEPELTPPSLTPSPSPRRIGTNEILHLAATVGGYPRPRLQWYRHGTLLPGETNRGLRLPVHADTGLGEFRLVAQNDLGTNEVTFPAIERAVRSPMLAGDDPNYLRPSTNFVTVSQIVSLADGSILAGGGVWGGGFGTQPMVVRLAPDGTLDPSFGTDGVVSGNGAAERLRVLPDGGILVAGEFTRLEGEPASGLVELDARGQRVNRRFPTLENPRVTAVLPLPDGGHLLGGRFSKVDGIDRRNLIRLRPDGTVDPSFQSPLLRWQGVDQLELDSRGGVLVAGARIYAELGESLTNPPPTGLLRLRLDGAADPVDPSFQRQTNHLRYLWIEPTGTLLVGMPPRRLQADETLLTSFETSPDLSLENRGFRTEHMMVRLPDGGVVAVRNPRAGVVAELARWRTTGERDFEFRRVFGSPVDGSLIQALGVAPDGAVLVVTTSGTTTQPPATVWRVRRLLPDSDLRLLDLRVANGSFTATLASQVGRRYDVTVGGLGRPEGALLESWDGDGYLMELGTPGDATQRFMELRREWAPEP